MQLKELCQLKGITPERHTKAYGPGAMDEYNTARVLSTNVTLASKGKANVSIDTCRAALAGDSVIAIEDRLAIVDAINHAKKGGALITLHSIDWTEPPDTRTYMEKTQDYQRSLNEPRLRTGDALSREDRAYRAYVAFGGGTE